jgi:hypothetical protein
MTHKHLDCDAKEINSLHDCLLFHVERSFEGKAIEFSVDWQAAVFWIHLFLETGVSFEVSSATPASDVCLFV